MYLFVVYVPVMYLFVVYVPAMYLFVVYVPAMYLFVVYVPAMYLFDLVFVKSLINTKPLNTVKDPGPSTTILKKI
jgi:hypothetical protein